MDTVSVKVRSWIMSRVKGKNTRPELFARSLIHRLGYRYRLHVHKLPGIPDLVFISRRKVIFVNGCFWHGHKCRRGKNMPHTNSEYWLNKIRRNKARDIKNYRYLAQYGWQILILWECELKKSNIELLINKIKNYLG